MGGILTGGLEEGVPVVKPSTLHIRISREKISARYRRRRIVWLGSLRLPGATVAIFSASTMLSMS